MQSVFQCSRCGSPNYVGEQSCWNCGNRFQYNCPYCRFNIHPAAVSCPNCGANLMGAPQPMQPPVYPQQPPGNYQMPQQAGWGQQPAWGQQQGPNPYQMPQQQGGYGYGTQPPARQGSSTGILLLGILVFIVLAGATLGIITKGDFSSIIPSNSTTTPSTNEPANSSPETVPEPAPVEKIQVTAKELADAFAADKTAAGTKYKDKIVRVSGVVAGTDVSGTPYVTLTSGDVYESGARCNFTTGALSKIDALEPGQSVTIEGKVTGYDDADVIVENCSFVT